MNTATDILSNTENNINELFILKFYVLRKAHICLNLLYRKGSINQTTKSVTCSSIMAHSTWHGYNSIFVYLFICFVCQNVKAQDRRAYLERPTISMEYKVDVDGGGVDCYYQHVDLGATFFFSSQVIYDDFILDF